MQHRILKIERDDSTDCSLYIPSRNVRNPAEEDFFKINCTVSSTLGEA